MRHIGHKYNILITDGFPINIFHILRTVVNLCLLSSVTIIVYLFIGIDVVTVPVHRPVKNYF